MSSSDRTENSPALSSEAIGAPETKAHDAYVRRKVTKALALARSDTHRHTLEDVMRRFGVED